MKMSLEAVIGIANQAAQESQYAVNSVLADSEQALNRAIAERRRQDEIIASRSQQQAGKAEFDKESKAPAIGAPQAATEIKRRMSPVDPESQTSLLMLLPKAEQDYATLTYQILADQRNMS